VNELPVRTQSGDVVAALDSTSHDEAVALWAAAEADRSGSTLRLVSVVEAGLQLAPYEALAAGSPSLSEQIDADTRRHLDTVAESVGARFPGLKVVTEVLWGSSAAGLVEASETAQVMVLGSPAHAGFGSVVVPAMAHAHCPVVVVPEGSPTGRPRRAVVGVDGSEPGRRALEQALAMVDPDDGQVTCVVAWRTEVEAEVLLTYMMAESVPAIDERYAAMLDEVVGEVAPAHPGVEVTSVVRHGNTAKAILEVAEEQDADVVVVGSRGHGGFAGLLLGSVSRRVVAHADRPVVVVR
jgi:nucleotide-binding universal stress UspA family protein